MNGEKRKKETDSLAIEIARKKNEGDGNAEQTEWNVIPLLMLGFTFLVGRARFYD